MEDLANRLSQEILPRIRRPGQYVGLEINARCNPVRDAEVTVALAFPDAYTIGASHLGSQVLYHLLNDIPGVACDRTYCPEADAEQAKEMGKLADLRAELEGLKGQGEKQK